MGHSTYATFKTTEDKTNHVLKIIEEAYDWPKERRQQSYDALRAVLHALRDRLTVQESSDFAAQLPMLIRGLYYEGWKPSKVPVRMDKEAFLERVRQQFPYRINVATEDLVVTVLGALNEYVTEGELEDIRSIMPNDIAALLP
jgi:uncharacterized protein (DUF2267 family)